ncbi:unnamed protein product [Leptosia nina]|uniref:Uncharacterized protein n=1 Tax=Leptosia nina TaxID=320188 RepID=A0AAV1JL04_9NEOP
MYPKSLTHPSISFIRHTSKSALLPSLDTVASPPDFDNENRDADEVIRVLHEENEDDDDDDVDETADIDFPLVEP